MKPFLTLLIATLCAATSYGQTMKALSYNTNGVVTYSSTNVLTFTNERIDFRTIGADGTHVWDVVNNTFFTELSLQNSSISFFGTNAAAAAATTRTNLSLGATWLTNANVTNFRSAIGLGLPALTNTSNVTTMRALSGSTNANHPFTGSFTVVDDVNDVATVVVSNGIIVELQFP
jgi:hypothetical protein